MSAPGPDASTEPPTCRVVEHPEWCDCGADPDREYERALDI
jgi:hypothetical protein